MNIDRSDQDSGESHTGNHDARMGDFSDENPNNETEMCAEPS